jgi:hypothetical protein
MPKKIPNVKKHREIFSNAGNYYHAKLRHTIDKPFVFKRAGFGTEDAIAEDRRSGAHRGAFEDLTARDPAKVPRCIFRRFADVNEAETRGACSRNPERRERSASSKKS